MRRLLAVSVAPAVELLRDLSRAGDPETLAALLALLLVVGGVGRWRRPLRVGIILGLALAVTAVSIWLLKLLFNRGADGIFHAFWQGSRGEMFPSGHTAVAFTAAMVLAQAWPRWRWVPWIVATGVALSRALFFHFLSDVVAGALIGACVGYYAVELATRTTFLSLRPRQGRKGQVTREAHDEGR